MICDNNVRLLPELSDVCWPTQIYGRGGVFRRVLALLDFLPDFHEERGALFVPCRGAEVQMALSGGIANIIPGLYGIACQRQGLRGCGYT